MKTYETELFTGGGCHAPITVHYEVEAETVQIDHITGPVWVEDQNKFIMADITPYVDEYAYEGIKNDIYQIEDENA